MVIAISHSHVRYRYRDAPLPTFSATGADGPIIWSAPSGSFAPSTTSNGQVTIYSPVDEAAIVTIAATAGSDIATAEIVIIDDLPLVEIPSLAFDPNEHYVSVQ